MPVFNVKLSQEDKAAGMKPEDPFNEQYKKCIQAARFRVKWKDIFNVKAFYKAIHEWTKEYDWFDMEDKSDHYETLYFEKIGLFNEKELWLRWRLQKIPPPGNSKYYKYHMDLDWHFLYLVPTEVVHEGKKFKKDVYKGEVEVWITALIEVDYENRWKKSPLAKYFQTLVKERIFHHDMMEEHRRELYREAYILQNYMKQWFKLRRFLTYEETEPFIPSEAYPTYTKTNE